MKLVESFLTKNPCYKAAQIIKPQGLMLHSVGCPQPSAKVFINNWNRPSYDRACVHGFIDANDGTIYQTLPWNYRGWHGYKGKNGCCNDTHIGVEMCEPAQIKYVGGASFTVSDANYAAACKAAKTTYESAVELFAFLCIKFNLDPAKDIISHKEGSALGIASAHGDPEHLWKGLKLGYTMDGFRSDVAKCMSHNGSETPKDPPIISEFKPYKVKVNIPNLNIRTGPGKNYSYLKGKYTGIGVFTIVEESAGSGSAKGWGKLKSGLGWISLDYVTRL